MTASQPSWYRPEIDGLRALAVLAVLVNHIHTRLLPGGFLGVDVFFVISGYVITSSLAHRQQAAFSSFILSFYERRFKRLIPALLVCILISSLLYSLFVQIPSTSFWTGLAAAFGFSNLQLYTSQTDYFASATELNLFLHTWSLGVEEQFYILYPLIFWLATRHPRLLRRLIALGAVLGTAFLAILWFHSGKSWIPEFMRSQGKAPYAASLMAVAALTATIRQPNFIQRRNRFLFFALGILSILSLLFFWLLSTTHPEASFYLMPNRFWEMGAGCLLALYADPDLRSAHILHPRQPQRNVSAALLAALCGSFFLPSPWKPFTTPLVVTFTLLLILTMDSDTESHGVAKQFLRLPWMISIGLISYSLYLWHWPILVIVRWTIGIHTWTIPLLSAVIVLASLASYTFVETPLRRARWAPTPQGTIGMGIALESLMAGGLFLLIQQPSNIFYTGAGDVPFNLESLSVPGTSITVSECGRLDEKAIQRCVIKARNGQSTLHLYGDSHAGHLYPAMGKVISRTGVGLATFNTAGNAHQPFPVISFQQRDGRKNAYLDGLPAKAKEINTFYAMISPRMQRGDSVLLSSDLYRYFDLRQPNKDSRFAEWKTAVANLAKNLEPKGIQVFVVAPFPHFKSGGGPICSPQWFRPTLSSSCFADLPLDAQLNERSAIVKELNQMQTKNLHIYDPFPLFCHSSTRTCLNHAGQEVYYLDGDHLSPNSASLLADDMISFLRQHGAQL